MIKSERVEASKPVSTVLLFVTRYKPVTEHQTEHGSIFIAFDERLAVRQHLSSSTGIGHNQERLVATPEQEELAELLSHLDQEAHELQQHKK